ncbi:46251_t:CDS:2, partial [Gigaspora margarita]
MCLILTPLQGLFFGLRLYLSINIPEEYPRIALKVSIQTAIEYPNIFDSNPYVFSSVKHDDNGYICIDILKDNSRSSRGYNGGYTAMNELTDDAWLHIIEFLTEQEIFLLSEAYPHINTLVHHFNILLCQQLVYFYLHKTFNKAILGIGVSKRKLTIEVFDLFSYEAFNEHNLQDRIWGNSFSQFLPIALNQNHFNHLLLIIQLFLMKLRDYLTWDPSIILKMILEIMNTMVANLIKACDDSRTHYYIVLKASEKALQGYCLLFYLLIMLLEKYPEIIKEAKNKVSKFMNPEEKSKCHKSCMPNLGKFIIYLFLYKNMDWSEFCPYFLKKLLARNRLNTTFELSNTSLRLILFQVSFLKIMRGIVEDIKKQDWEQVVSKMLKDAINKSFHSGYHQVPYIANKLYFIRHKKESHIPSPICWDENSEE